MAEVREILDNFKKHMESYPTKEEMSLVVKAAVLEANKEMMQSVKENFVPNERFKPVEVIAYAITGTTGLAVIGALLALVIK